MASDTLVENQIEDGRKFLRELIRAHFAVTVAFWVKTSEEGHSFFYVASSVVDQEGLAAAYRKAYQVLNSIREATSVEYSNVKLIGPTNPLAADVLKICDRTVLPARIGAQRLGSVSIDEGYVYAWP